jgi:hypothetical protein
MLRYTIAILFCICADMGSIDVQLSELCVGWMIFLYAFTLGRLSRLMSYIKYNLSTLYCSKLMQVDKSF